jgi:Leucine-rich repeat (LRR) protein
VSNNIESLPETISNLKSLKTLDLRNNNLQILPRSLFNLQELQELDLRNNKFETIPGPIWKLKGIKQYFLKLDGNPLDVKSRRIIAGGLETIQKFSRERDKLKGLLENLDER